ncbi:glycosyltransferase, family 2 [Thermococcus kodakarensis KOD1]|uniref:Glycosyltransferase, family 2 n=1 Tax=Thermococcus kodakarensis (strain ATCC BAA-918 / JCM 12380 / KOD1) TaxID=69014 RepID=Q5JIZ9_THEKO|nr:glycosyltransferase family 2 protein [Thermococcus kodakarensis]WCN27633.1 glycosyltransferase family 2 protein [Thermococcus kodakarensis]WCN29924.1 glycosyltransferase family 2 protein [Thermococcus kodakarensis]BAD85903.1 glycosyltransferase, family 2 [Thermococcus kodakarensis KOD1]
MAKVSIIVPVYNTRDYVPRLLSSIEKQTYEDWELILVDDNSDDGTYELLLDFKDKHPDRVEVLRTPKRRSGVSVGRNMGIEVASGRYIAFIDSDDWWSESFLEDTVSHIKGFGGVSTEYYDVFEETGKKIHVRASKHGELSWKDVLMLKARFGVGSSLLRADIINDYGLRFPENIRYSEDAYFFTLYLSLIEKVYSVPKPDFYHLVRRSSAVQGRSKTPEEKIRGTLEAYNKLCLRVKEVSGKHREVCDVVARQLRPFSFMTYITIVSDTYGRKEARKLFWKYFDYIKTYRPVRSHSSYLTLIWIVDLFVPIRPLLRKMVSKK